MKEDIREYAKLGLVHHMLYPECTTDPRLHTETLLEFIKRNDIETFDCCLPYGEKYRKKLIPAIRNCDKTVCFTIHLYPLQNLPLAAVSYAEQSQMWMIIDDMIQQAIAIGAEGFIFAPGIPSFYDATPEHFAAFDKFCLDLCSKLKPYNITAMLEPFDIDIDKKFLYGPIDECVKLATRICEKHNNFGFELDVAHLPLLGETFEHAIKMTAPKLKRVHLGNCVLKNKSNPLYGDQHPPIGIKGGEIDIPELIQILKLLLEIKYLNKQNRGALLVEMQPFPGSTAEDTVSDSFERIQKAWEMV